MACSRFEYVKQFEENKTVLPNCWLVVRVDGRGFTEFSKAHRFLKPNDDRALNLMTAAAEAVAQSFGEIILAYGQSDEYSFVFHRQANLWRRREMKIATNLVSKFTAEYVMLWPRFFPREPLQYAPSFDARAVAYPTDQNLRDYISWRQADYKLPQMVGRLRRSMDARTQPRCSWAESINVAFRSTFTASRFIDPTDTLSISGHINNQYNYCFWKLVETEGRTPEEAYEILKGTRTADKNEMLFSKFDVNYSQLPELHRKGTTLIRVPAKFIIKRRKKEEKARQPKTPTQTEEFADPCDYEVPVEPEPLSAQRCTDRGSYTSRSDKSTATRTPSSTASSKPLVTLETPSSPGIMKLNVDIIGDAFWKFYDFLLSPTV